MVTAVASLLLAAAFAGANALPPDRSERPPFQQRVLQQAQSLTKIAGPHSYDIETGVRRPRWVHSLARSCIYMSSM